VPRLARLASAPLRVLALAATWTALEFARANLLTGAPWDLLAHALYAHPLWIQSADVGGTFLISFLLAATGAAAGEVLAGAPRRGAAALTAGALLVAAAGYGALRLAGEDDGGPYVRVALVQGNVPNAWRVDPAHADQAFQAFATATAAVVSARPDLVVWPENAVSFLLAPNQRFATALLALLGAGGPPLLLGGPRFAPAGTGHVQFFNAAHLLAASGASLGVYDKRRLVPFAEYAPVPRVPGLGWRFDAPGDYTPGGEPTIFPQPAPFGVLICFEAIYPDLARDLVGHGARFLLNISNDAWFGTTAGLEQHFAIAVFRAVETRRALARATNTGITAVVEPSGRIGARFPTHVREAWVIPVPLRVGTTLYGRLGDAFGWLVLAGAALAWWAAGRRLLAP
jgi:apolipoprotein N-acyltransferase